MGKKNKCCKSYKRGNQCNKCPKQKTTNMRIIKKGKLEEWEKTCDRCNTVFKYDATDISIGMGRYDPEHLNCPHCFQYIPLGEVKKPEKCGWFS